MRMAKMLAIATIALGTIGQTGWGQDGQPPNEREVERLRDARERAMENRRQAQVIARTQPASPSVGQEESVSISVNFPGGTIAEYVAALRKASPSVNIVVSPEAASQPAPEIILRDVDLSVAAAAVQSQREVSAGQWESVQVEPLGNWGGSGALHAFRVTYQQHSRSSANTAKLDASAWSVSDLLMNGYESDQVLAAIQVGQALFGEAATIKYHEPTHLLVARGTPEQLGLISRTLDQLRIGLPATSAEALLRRNISTAERRISELQSQLESTQVKIVETRRQLESEDAGAKPRTTAEERGRLEGRLRQLELERDELAQKISVGQMSIRQSQQQLESPRRGR